MSFIGKKGRRTKSISSSLKAVKAAISTISARSGVDQFDTITDDFIPILLRYSEQKGLDFCAEHNLLELTRNPHTIKELLYEKDWSYHAMLEDLLDFLTCRGVFKKKERSYQSRIQYDPKITNDETEPNNDSSASHDISVLGLGLQVNEPHGLLSKDKQWIAESTEYKVVFTLFDRILNRFLMDSMKTGTQTANMSDEAGQLGPLMDSYYRNPYLTVPRMGLVAAAFKRKKPTKILDLNCGTGRCAEELYLINPNVEIIGVTSNSYHINVAKRNIGVFADLKGIHPHIEWRVVDYSQSLTEQLEDLVRDCDMVLVNQLFQFCSHESHPQVCDELLSFLRPNGVIALFQHLREIFELPWPHEWFYRAIHGFSGIPVEKKIRDYLKRAKRYEIREFIPLIAFLVY